MTLFIYNLGFQVHSRACDRNLRRETLKQASHGSARVSVLIISHHLWNFRSELKFGPCLLYKNMKKAQAVNSRNHSQEAF